MRRKDRAITDETEIKEILDSADSCQIAFNGPRPYIVALNYGYTWNNDLLIYFHCAKEGRKIDLLKEFPEVCFHLDTDHELTPASTACNWGMKYASITGYGQLSIVQDEKEKIEGLNAIMHHYGFPGTPVYDPTTYSFTYVLKLSVTEISVKRKS